MRYKIGQRWRVVAEGRPTFDFVIIGKGARKDSKKCQIDLVDDVPNPGKWGHGMIQDYTHKHLQTHAKLIEE